MPISGLPNPDIHRLCKCCRQWFNAHEGDYRWPPKAGMFSWVHVTLIESTDQLKAQKFYCAACQELNAQASARFIKTFKVTTISAIVFTVLAVAIWASGILDVFIAGMRR